MFRRTNVRLCQIIFRNIYCFFGPVTSHLLQGLVIGRGAWLQIPVCEHFNHSRVLRHNRRIGIGYQYPRAPGFAWLACNMPGIQQSGYFQAAVGSDINALLGLNPGLFSCIVLPDLVDLSFKMCIRNICRTVGTHLTTDDFIVPETTDYDIVGSAMKVALLIYSQGVTMTVTGFHLDLRPAIPVNIRLIPLSVVYGCSNRFPVFSGKFKGGCSYCSRILKVDKTQSQQLC